MGAKKKGLANKLAKMSDEERARYLQQRADIEEEARRRKEQLIATFMKNKLKKEDGFLRLNLSKINQYWHQILRKVKCKEMKDELEHMKRWIERIVGLKNRTIENLIQELEDAEEQYANNLQAHLSHIDDMLEHHREYISTISSTYEEDRDRLLEMLKNDKESLNAKASEEQTYLKTIIYGQQSESVELAKNAQTKYDDDKIEKLTSFKLSLGKLRKEREDILCAIWKQIANVLRLHVDNVDKKRSHLAELKRLDAESAAEILKNQDRINQEEQTLEKLKQEHEVLTDSTEEALKYLQVDVDKFSRQFSNVKIQLQKNLLTDERQLIFMTDESNKSIKHLEDALNRGTQILQLAETCKKYETEKDFLIRYLPKIKDRSEKYGSTHSAFSSSSSSSSTSPTKTDASVDDSLYAQVPEGFVKYKIRRPKTSYDERMQKRMQKSIQKASEDMEKDGDYTPTTKSYKSTKSRPQTFRKYRTFTKGSEDNNDKEIQFSFDYPFFESYHQLKDLEKLWSNCNNAEINVIELKSEKSRLFDENKHLRGMLRSILEAATLDKSGMSSKIPTRVCSRYKASKSAPIRRKA